MGKKKLYSKEELLTKIKYHQDKADYYYSKLEDLIINNQIGFKYKGKI